MTATDAGLICAEIVKAALPVAVVFALANVMIRSFLTGAFGGKMVL